MKAYLHIALLLIFAMFLFDCSNKGTEPGDELPKYENNLEFIMQHHTDSGFIDIPLDTFSQGIYPRIKVTVNKILKPGSRLFVSVLNQKQDTIATSELSIRETDTLNIFYLVYLRIISEGIYYGNAYYVEDGIKHDIGSKNFVILRPKNKIVLFSKDIDGNEILKNSFRFGEIIFPKIVLSEPLTHYTKFHVYVEDTSNKIVYSKVKNIGLLEDLEWYFSSLPKDLLGECYIWGYTDNEYIPRSYRELMGASFTITKE